MTSIYNCLIHKKLEQPDWINLACLPSVNILYFTIRHSKIYTAIFCLSVLVLLRASQTTGRDTKFWGCKTNWLDKSHIKLFVNFTRKSKVILCRPLHSESIFYCVLGTIPRFMWSVDY